jgi:hypothetical protein
MGSWVGVGDILRKRAGARVTRSDDFRLNRSKSFFQAINPACFAI